MPDHLSAMDVAVVADDGTRVASPMKLLEYMAMARAVIAPGLENITDVVTANVDALLFTPQDGRSLADGLRRLIHDPRLREQLGQAARHTVCSSRTWRGNAERVISLLAARPRVDSDRKKDHA
jgi:glycosyltransferase involved in cell wall biosynthesis